MMAGCQYQYAPREAVPDENLGMKMKKPQADFEYMHDLLNGFFKMPNIRSALRVIQKQQITGWEIWFQVEFARFLSEHISEPDWEREYAVEFDYRREKLGYFFKPDFIIRKKHWPKDRYVALEIKQHIQLGNCLTNMVADLAKVAKIRKSQLDLRSIWALGIFPYDPAIDVRAMIEDKLYGVGQPYHETRTATARIPRTKFSYALF
ncbi:hypothetical protein CER19_02525 [Pseudomonas sp. GL93]|uniref:hypothetical protein n=1 Tax=Pseudomonas sp. GL93 TaxID=2014741 RepID=UPI000E320FCA|nr:hypothetical protein [Pseudomonas sp. GL93]RFD33855.1 hypothetical protein CER19_02525 [Pseudomonas sp. GL93]